MADTQGAGPPTYSSPIYDPSANQRGWNDPPSLAFSQKSGAANGRRIDPRKRVAHNFNSNGYTQGAPVALIGQPQPHRIVHSATPPPMPYNGAPGAVPHMTHSSSYPALSHTNNGSQPASPYYAPPLTSAPPMAGQSNVNHMVAGNGTAAPPSSFSPSTVSSPGSNLGQPLHTFQPNGLYAPVPNGNALPANGPLIPPVPQGYARCTSMPNLPDSSQAMLSPPVHQGPPPTDGYYVRRASSAESSRQNSPIVSPPVNPLQKSINGSPAVLQ